MSQEATVNQQVDLTSLEEIFRKDYAQLCRVAWFLVGDQARAEELVMDAFARFLRDRPKPEDPLAAGAYMRAAVVNRCRDHLRRRRIEWRVNAQHAARAPEATTTVDSDDEVLKAVRALPLRQRTIVVLTYFADLPESAVAAELGISVGTVKTQLSRARVSLASTLKEES